MNDNNVILRWSPALSAWVQVLDERRLFGRDMAQVRVLGDDRVLNVASASLTPERPPDLQGALATLATARIWQALEVDRARPAEGLAGDRLRRRFHVIQGHSAQKPEARARAGLAHLVVGT